MFYRIYDILEEERLTGVRFVRLATQLPRYDGAVRRRLEQEFNQEQVDVSGGYSQDDPDGRFEAGQSMSMSEALSRSKGNDGDMAVLDSLNRDSQNSPFGSLFEYETG